MSDPKDPLWDDAPEEATKPVPVDDDLYPLAPEPKPPLPPTDGSSREAAVWHAVTRSGRQEGPMDLATLKALLASNEVTSGSLVWRDGMPQWVPAREVPELFPMRSSEPPTKPGSAPPVPPTSPVDSSPPRRAAPPPKPSAEPPGGYESTFRLLESWVAKPAFFRWTGRAAGALGIVLLIGSIFLWLFSVTWFGGVLWCTILFLVGEGIAQILESLARIEKAAKESGKRDEG